MDVKEIQNEREALENKIRALVAEYELKTETNVNRIKFTRHEFQKAGGGKVHGAFEVEIEIIL